MDYSVEENASELVQDEAQVVNAPDADGEVQEEVSIADYMPNVEQEHAEDTGDGDQLPNVSNQKDFNKALRERLSKESDKGYQRGRTEIENSPEMQYVRQLIEDRAREKGISAQQALEDLQNERINRQADYYAKNPSAWFAEQMRSQQQAQTPNTGLSSDAFVQQMAEAIRNNQIPQGFDVRNPPVEFLQDAHDFGVPAALRMHTLRHAEAIQQQANAQQIAEELQKRQRGSKPMSPSSANPNITKEFDFRNMSSKDFAELDKKLMKAALEGKTIR